MLATFSEAVEVNFRFIHIHSQRNCDQRLQDLQSEPQSERFFFLKFGRDYRQGFTRRPKYQQQWSWSVNNLVFLTPFLIQKNLFAAFSQGRFVIGFIYFTIKDEKKQRSCDVIF